MTNKKTILLIAAILLALAAILWLVSLQQKSKITKEANQPITNTPVTNTTPKKSGEPKSVKSPLGEFNPENPEKTAPLSDKKVEELKKNSGIIQLTVGPTTITPKEFSVSVGQTISLTVKAVGASHTLVFQDSALSNVVVGTSKGEVRGISFIAPERSGDYIFYCEESGHRERGEQGVMHVR